MQSVQLLKHVARIGGAVLMVAAMAAPAWATGVPRIQDVVFSGTSGDYTATITGVNFGVSPGGIPCTACSPLELQVVDMANQPHQMSVNVTGWTDTSITVSGIAASAGDGMRISVYNLVAGNVDAWGGHIGRKAAGVPKITSIVSSGTGASRSFTITGLGFGAAPDGLVGQNTDSPFLVVTDWNASAPGTDGFPFNAGFCGTPDCNGVSVTYNSWSDTEIVVTYGNGYGQGSWSANPRDAYCIGVWPSTSTSSGTTGGTVKCKRLPK